MVHQTRLRLPVCDCTLQRSHSEAATHHRSIHSPPYNLARETIEDHRYGRMCGKLGMELIAASSPQAKGRVERVHGTHQDGLVKKLRRKGIVSHEAANVYLRSEYLAEHNRPVTRLTRCGGARQETFALLTQTYHGSRVIGPVTLVGTKGWGRSASPPSPGTTFTQTECSCSHGHRGVNHSAANLLDILDNANTQCAHRGWQVVLDKRLFDGISP